MPDMQESSTGNLGSNSPKVPLRINTLNEEWHLFCKGIGIAPENCKTQELIERKRMFFAGATVMMSLMQQVGDVANVHGDEQAEKVMQSLAQQLRGFALAVKMGKA